jgi:arsenate reductase-like glutaredoxin family protein
MFLNSKKKINYHYIRKKKMEERYLLQLINSQQNNSENLINEKTELLERLIDLKYKNKKEGNHANM